MCSHPTWFMIVQRVKYVYISICFHVSGCRLSSVSNRTALVTITVIGNDGRDTMCTTVLCYKIYLSRCSIESYSRYSSTNLHKRVTLRRLRQINKEERKYKIKQNSIELSKENQINEITEKRQENQTKRNKTTKKCQVHIMKMKFAIKYHQHSFHSTQKLSELWTKRPSNLVGQNVFDREL